MPATTKNLFFIDSHVADYETLIANLPIGSEWFLLNLEEDGIAQMVAALSGYSGLEFTNLELIGIGPSSNGVCRVKERPQWNLIALLRLVRKGYRLRHTPHPKNRTPPGFRKLHPGYESSAFHPFGGRIVMSVRLKCSKSVSPIA